MRPLISIIIPVYNVSKYIERCLTSIDNQTCKKHFEVIIIDDGSTDQSFNICKLWASSKNYVNLTHQENQGVAQTRNIGIDLSRGQYLLFVDPDDYLEKDAIEILISKVTNLNPNIVMFQYENVIGEERITSKMGSKNIYPHVLQSKSIEIIKLIIEMQITNFLWQMLIKKDVVVKDNLKFENVSIDEDTLFVIKAIFYSETIFFDSNVLYFHLQREESIANTATKEKAKDIFLVTEAFQKFAKENFNNIEYSILDRYLIKRWLRAYTIGVKSNISSNDNFMRVIRTKILNKDVHNILSRRQKIKVSLLKFNLLGAFLKFKKLIRRS